MCKLPKLRNLFKDCEADHLCPNIKLPKFHKNWVNFNWLHAHIKWMKMPIVLAPLMMIAETLTNVLKMGLTFITSLDVHPVSES